MSSNPSEKIEVMEAETPYKDYYAKHLSYQKCVLPSESWSYGRIDIWRVTNEESVFNKLIGNMFKKLNMEYLQEDPSKTEGTRLLNIFSCDREPYSYEVPTYAIMYSGGYDSTSLAIRHLEKGENVVLYGLNFGGESVLAACLAAKVLQKVYGKQRVKGLTMIGPDLYNRNFDPNGMQQQPFSAFFAAMIPETVKNNVQAVECAFIMNDDALSYEEDLKDLYNARMALYRREQSPKLEFPLRKYKHWENVEVVRDFEKKYDVVIPVHGMDHPSCDLLKEKNNLWITWHCYRDGESYKENKEAGDYFGYIVRVKDYFCHVSKKDIYSKLSLIRGYESIKSEEETKKDNKVKALEALNELMEEGILTKDDLKDQLNKDIKPKERKVYGRLERKCKG